MEERLHCERIIDGQDAKEIISLWPSISLLNDNSLPERGFLCYIGQPSC